MRHLSTYIVTFLLTAFAWSCFGLGLGMIGHNVVSANQSHHKHNSPIDTGHECCVAMEQQSSSDGPITATMDHQMEPVVFGITKIFALFLATVFVLKIFLEKSLPSFHRFYIRYWERYISYFALFYRQLFKAGILHPKTW